MSDYNMSLLDWQDGKGPQYKVIGQNVMRPHEGDVAPYQQVVDINGVPFSSSNRLPIDATNQTLSTQLTGSNVEIPWKESLYITDTNVYHLPDLDVSDASDFYIIIVSSLDQDLTFSLESINGKGFLGYASTDGKGNKFQITVTTAEMTNRPVIYNPEGLPYAKTIKAYVNCSVAPTTGSVSAYVVKRGKV